MAVEKTEKDKKAEAKILDAEDETFSGFLSLQIVDQDGLPRVTKGSANQSALHLEKKDGKVFLSASFTPNPIYYLQIQRDSQMFLTGSLWFGEEKRNRLNTIGGVMPKSCEQIVTTMDKCKEESFTSKVELPFLADAPNRLAPLVVVTKEEKFVTKVVSVKLELSAADWEEWKQ